MAVKIYTAKAFKFTWSGMEIGMRLPTVDEMVEIVRKRDEFFQSITDETPQGDQAIQVEFQFLVGKTLACDPDDITNPWFAKDAEQQKQLATNGVNKNTPNEVPSPFFAAATEFFNTTITRENLSDEDKKKYDTELAKALGDSEAGKLPETSGIDSILTPLNSDDSLSESPSTTELDPITSTSGPTSVS